MDLKFILKSLKTRRDQVSAAIDALIKVQGGDHDIPSPSKHAASTSFNFGALAPKPKRKTMSKVARAKIAAAQRKRWAKLKTK